MSDLASLKTQALQALEQAYANAKQGSLYTNARINSRGGRYSGPPTRLFSAVWRSRSRREQVLVEMEDWQEFDVVALALLGRQAELRSRQNVIEFPARMREIA